MDLNSAPKLEKVISYGSYITLGLGIVIGVGWVVYSGQWLTDGGPLGAILGFLLGGLCLIPVGKCYAELTSAIPVAGGELAFSYKAFGPFVAFLTSWSLALAYTTLAPFETIAIGGLFEKTFPSLTSSPLYFIGDDHVSISTIIPGLLAAFFVTWLNVKGAKKSTYLQNILIFILLGLAVIFSAVALYKGEVSNLTPLFASEGAFWAVGPASIISVLVVVPWFMSGFDAIPQAAEEAGKKIKPKQLGKAIVATIVASTIFYVIIILSVSISMPWQETTQLPWATADVFKAAFGYEWATQMILIAALTGLLSTFNGMMIAGSRLLFAMGRGGLLPHWFGKVDEKFHTPKNAIFFIGGFSLIGPFIGTSALGPIVNSSSLAFTAVLFLTSLVAIKLRKSHPKMDRPYKTKKATLYLGAVVSFILCLLMVLPQSPGQLSNLEFAIIIIWVGLGLVGYSWRQKTHAINAEDQAQLILGVYK